MNHLLLTRDALNVMEINELVSHESCGAISMFLGTTRDNFDSKKVVSLEYEAYEPMALKQMESICEELRAKWPDVFNIAFYHRLGLVPVKEASVVIAVSSPHRQASLDAMGYAIEELKKRVPIWKKEQYEDNESAWKENKECQWLKKDPHTSSSKPSQGVKRLKLAPLHFNQCSVECSKEAVVTRNLIQIAAAEHEIHRRIQCFVQKKREEIDLHNIMDFTALPAELIVAANDDEVSDKISTCARTDSIVVKQEHSKCHLRVRRVENRIGPQTRPDYLQTLDKLMGSTLATAKPCNSPNSAIKIKEEPGEQLDIKIEAPKSPKATGVRLSSALEERLGNIEQHLNMSERKLYINPKHVHERLKAIENRLLYLEAISPEYKHFMQNDNKCNQHVVNSCRNKTELVNSQQKVQQSKSYTVAELDAIIGQMERQQAEQQTMSHNMGFIKTEVDST